MENNNDNPDDDSGFEGLSIDQFKDLIEKAGRDGADKTMKSIGYVVIALDGYVVKKYSDGTIEKLEKI